MRRSILFLVLVLFPGILLYPQSGSNQSNNDLKKATSDLKKSVQGIGQLFKKKKTDSAIVANENNTAADNGSQPSRSNNSLNTQPPTKNRNSQGLKAGDIMPGAKYIDADEFSPFNNGAAIIRKGSSYAMIDTKGNFIIPFNVYSHLSFGPINNYGYTNGFNGLFSYTKSNGETGILNATGKVLATSQAGKNNVAYADNNSMIQVTDISKAAYTYIYMDANGKSYPLKQPIQFIQEGIGQFNTNAGTVFIKLTGEALTSSAFAEVTPFANGMAIVSSADQFGQRKYGYLSREGKLAIPFNFSLKPGLFASGYAKVEPKDKSEFEYAFINKQGNIVLRQTLADVNKYGKFGDFKTYGFAFSQGYILDSTLKITSMKDFFKSYGIVDENIWYTNNMPVLNESNPKIYYSYSHARNLMDNPTIGFIHLKTGKVVSPVFELPAWSGINYFDPV